MTPTCVWTLSLNILIIIFLGNSNSSPIKYRPSKTRTQQNCPTQSELNQKSIDPIIDFVDGKSPLLKTNYISFSGAFLVMQFDPNWNTIHNHCSHPSKPMSFTNMARSTPSMWRSWPNSTRSCKSSLDIETLPPSMRQTQLIWPSKQLNHGIWWSICPSANDKLCNSKPNLIWLVSRLTLNSILTNSWTIILPIEMRC